MLAAPAANVNSKLVLQRHETALQSADNARRDAGGMPVHPHDGTERLKPEGMGKPLKEFIATVMVHDRLRDNRAKARHPYGKPCRHASAMQRKIGAATSPSHHAPQEGT
jgi:hypothetical protein